MGIKVLVVDDSRVSRMMIRAFMLDQCPDWKVVEAANGEEALSAIQEATADGAPGFDLVTLDYSMPGEDGLTLAKRLRSAGCAGALVLFTANIQASLQAEAETLGVRFVGKPVTPASVGQAIAAVTPRP